MPEHPTRNPSLNDSPTADQAVTGGVTNSATTVGSDPTTAYSVSLIPTGRYELGEEIAHGGMGIIYLATDMILGREVAVKVLLEKFSSISAAASRFADEARITAQLQHPAIPPIHDLGTLSEGRPFLAMKLIKGQTLEDQLSDRPTPSHDRSRFIAVFEQICQALAYAHDRNVIHRDLKPANVMVGSFGEVQVMDWGLAKVLGNRADGTRGDPEEMRSGTEIRSTRDSDGSETQAGSVLGTPAFMPPEQAVGAIGKIDKRSDVFGLGAILAVILTGRPPYFGNNVETTRVLCAQGKVDECFSRLDTCGADPELVALCKRCLAPEQEPRPKDAGEVARVVAELRGAADERARRAEVDRVKIEAEKVAAELKVAEQRKRRRVQLLLVGVVGLLVVGVGVFGWWQDKVETRERTVAANRDRDEQDRRVRNGDAAAALLVQCEEALRAGDAGKAELALKAAAKYVAEGGTDDLAEKLGQRLADLAMLRELDAAEQFRWTPLPTKERRFPYPNQVAAKFREVLARFAFDLEASNAEETIIRLRASPLRHRLVAALDRILGMDHSDNVRAILRDIDTDQYRNDIRDAALAGDRAKIVELTLLSVGLEQPPEFVALLCENKDIPIERSRELLRAAIVQRPGSLVLLMAMGDTYPLNKRDGVEERTRWFQAAVAVAPDNPATHNLLGIALYDKGDLDGAIAAYKKSIRVHSTYLPAHFNLGNALAKKGDTNGAIVAYTESIRLNPNYCEAHYGLGLALTKKNSTEAKAAYREAIRCDSEYLPPHTNLAILLQIEGDLDGAVTEFKKALLIDQNHAITHYNFGLALRQKGDLDGAIVEYKEALRINPMYAEARTNLAYALSFKGDKDEAIAEFKETVRRDPNFVQARNGLGWALQSKGNLDEAIAEYKEVLRIDPENSYSKEYLPRAERMRLLLSRLPDVLAGRVKPATPKEACEFGRLCAQPTQKQYSAAVRLFEEAFSKDPALANSLAASYRYTAAYSAVRAALGDGVEAPRDPAERIALRAKALAYLRADLTLRKKQAASSSATERKSAVDNLTFWQTDKDLSALRPGLARIVMSADERADWDALWADVRRTIAEAQKPFRPPEVAPLPRETRSAERGNAQLKKRRHDRVFFSSV